MYVKGSSIYLKGTEKTNNVCLVVVYVTQCHSVLDFQSQCLSLAPMFAPGSSVTSTLPFINQECTDTGQISSLAVLIGLRS